jgi:hypothetical protein
MKGDPEFVILKPSVWLPSTENSTGVLGPEGTEVIARAAKMIYRVGTLILSRKPSQVNLSKLPIRSLDRVRRVGD